MNNSLSHKVTFTVLLVILFQYAQANNETAMPDINGTWINLAGNGEETNAIVTITQDGKYLEGKFTDSREGNVIVEAPITGYIDTKGNVIFDIYFGRITSTNRLKLSNDRNNLQGTFTNNTGNAGEVNLRRK